MPNTPKTELTPTTKKFLWAGILAGPMYLLVSFSEILTRPGFNITRHSWSVLSNGELGWIHITNFLITGLFTVLGAMGLTQALQDEKGKTWGPAFLTLYGLCLMAAGVFKADAVDGFPPGTPLGPPTTVSTSGILHLVFGMIGFIGLIAACIGFSRRYKSLGQNSQAWFSLFTGVFFFFGFMSIIVGSGFGDTGLTASIVAFTTAVILSWVWYSTLCWHILTFKSKQ